METKQCEQCGRPSEHGSLYVAIAILAIMITGVFISSAIPDFDAVETSQARIYRERTSESSLSEEYMNIEVEDPTVDFASIDEQLQDF